MKNRVLLKIAVLKIVMHAAVSAKLSVHMHVPMLGRLVTANNAWKGAMW
jgi:hypothetical protein